MNINPAQLSRIADNLRAQFGDDDDLVRDMLEGELDVDDFLDRLLALDAECKAFIEANKALKAQYDERNRVLDNRALSARVAMQKVLDAAGVRKWARPAATVSIRAVKPRPVVTDGDAVPDEFCTFTRKPDMKTIGQEEDPAAVPGVEMSNGGETISIRRK